MVIFLYSINIILLVSCLLVFRFRSGERQFTLSLVRALFGLPLLIGEYFYLAYDFDPNAAHVVLFSEGVFAIVWLFMAQRLSRTNEGVAEPRSLSLAEIAAGAILGGLAAYSLINPPVIFLSPESLFFDHYGMVYFQALFVLAAMVFMAWRMEAFWRGLSSAHRWEYKFLVVGSYFVCGAMVWAASYRVAYLRLVPDHFILLGVLLSIAWGFMIYAVAAYRLLNRKIFISRKVAYSAIAPLAFGIYLLGLGVISLIMRYLGWSFSFILQWVFISLGIVAVFLYIHSGKIRRRIHFFISTHFYVNKYEYRDEWLKFSDLLKSAFTETEVVKALNQVLTECLYTKNLSIWVGDEERGYKMIIPDDSKEIKRDLFWKLDDSLIGHLKKYGHYYVPENNPDGADEEVVKKKRELLKQNHLILLAPISIGEQVVGLIGLGPEYTGGRYGQDDFDLLAALGTQAASALLAVRMGEQLAGARQMETFRNISSFMIHDLKNVASILSLTLQNLPAYFNNPEFRQDAIKNFENSVVKIKNICASLSSVSQKLDLKKVEIDLNELVRNAISNLKGNSKISIINSQKPVTKILLDPEQIQNVVINLVLNASDALKEGGEIRISTKQNDGWVELKVSDNGCGMSKEFMERSLFRPFKTTKKQGMGIGLFQSKMIVEAHGGRIEVESEEGKGSTFRILLPIERV
ncbi:MAG: PEP-CTERM system histidine kinase PrsK [Thermodesulfobacteriota bacterium]|nr:PEP-CTERM system histidine kinase PrsK [Thermodesulfobacteriota bacterium]